MNQSIFTIPTPAFLTQLKDIAKPYGRINKANKSLILEMTITNKLLTLVLPGARFEIYCETRGTCKATVGFFYFIDIIKTLKGKSTICVITDKTIEINGLKITAQTTFFTDDSILRSIKLPLNYTDWHLLRLQQQGYTLDELEFNKLHSQIQQANRTFARTVKATADKLKIYGVTKEEIEELAIRKLMS
ncbi:MAG TPA: hypothetical protein VGB43_07715 [Flavobacterium sp.]|jgi:hypothetical protein